MKSQIERRSFLGGLLAAASLPAFGQTAAPETDFLPGVTYPKYHTIATGLGGFIEGPVLLADDSVLVSELRQGKINRVYPDGKVSLVAQIPDTPNGTAFGPDHQLYIANMGHGGTAAIQKLDVITGVLTTLADKFEGKEMRSPDDLVIDSEGGIYFTVLNEFQKVDMAPGIYYLDKAGVRQVIRSTVTTNGVGLSPAGDWLYWTEFFTSRVFRRRITAPGVLQAPAVPFGDCLYESPMPITFFDSLTVDGEGFFTIATNTGRPGTKSGLMSFTAEGTPVNFVPFPDRSTTHVAFSWKGEKTAYVTLAGSQSLVKLPWPRYGLKPRFTPPPGFA
jgi:gluconolactonase